MNKVIEKINSSKKILLIQADNPDGDSLASSLALEAILSDSGHEVIMYCGVDMPSYLRYLAGWDRVVNQIKGDHDLAIILDTSSLLLLETLQKTDELKWIKAKPCIIIDHHKTEATIDFAEIYIDTDAVSVGQIIYEMTRNAKWPLSLDSAEFIAISIMSDSLGLTSEGTTARTVEILAELVKSGVSLAKIDNARKVHQKKQPQLLKYKGELLQRIEYAADNSIAIITIPWEEIEKYSPLYNPPMLVLDEMRQVENVKLAVAFKSYPDGRITAKIRANYGFGVADKIAEQFGGGGHTYASGFRVTDGSKLDDVKIRFINEATKIFNETL